METPDWRAQASAADDLIDAQYADRPELRPIFEELLARASAFGEITIHARQNYVSLLTPRRTFAVVQPTTRTRLDLGLKLADPRRRGKLEQNSSMGSSVINARIALKTLDDVDEEVEGWLRLAYADNA